MQSQPGLLPASLWSEIMVCFQVHELEGELEGEIRRSAEAQRGARRLERCIKELTYQVLQESTHCLAVLHPGKMGSFKLEIAL